MESVYLDSGLFIYVLDSEAIGFTEQEFLGSHAFVRLFFGLYKRNAGTYDVGIGCGVVS